MRKMNCTKLITLIIILCTSTIYAQESLYPVGYDIQATYSLNDISYTTTDTIHIVRTISNNTESSLQNIYMIDLLPEEFELIGFELTRNGISVAYYYEAWLNYSEFPGYNLYEWMLDYPNADDTANVLIQSSQTLELTASFICEVPDTYILPFHSLCGNNDDTGFFTTSEEKVIDIFQNVGINNSEVELPEQLNNSIAYPNPFNSEVVIKLNNNHLIDHSTQFLQIYDITGRLVYSSNLAINNTFRWKPLKNTAGGIYFYSIHTEDIISQGKLVYLK